MWANILKGKATSPYNKKYVYKHGVTEEQFLSAGGVLERLKDKGGRRAGDFTATQLVFTLKALERDGLVESKLDKITGDTGGRTNYVFRKLPEPVNKSDWREMVDEMVTENTDFEEMYKKIISKLKFNSPSRKEINDYLRENYKRNSLWSNLWSREEQ